jgi:hypothetical protein
LTTIFEPIYLPGQSITETSFWPLVLPDNSHAAWREVRILVDFYRRGDHLKDGKTGIFSPKFGLKTKVSAEDFLKFVEANHSADVCIINAFPAMPYYSFNVWMQGEINHPGLTERTQALLDASGIAWNISAVPRHTAKNLCYSNFWVGSQTFWESYVGGILDKIVRFLEQNPDSAAARSVMDVTYHTDAAPFLPFIVERLFSTFLSLNEDVSVAAYEMEPSAKFSSVFTQVEADIVEYMVPIVDKADAKGVFPDDLKQLQLLLMKNMTAYSELYMAQNAHRHSGRTVPIPK